MNAEGYGVTVSPEWVAATSTGFLWLAAALWLVIGIGALWRRTIWQRVGAEIVSLAEARRGTVRATSWGFRLDIGEAHVEWRYGPFDGPITRGGRGKTSTELVGWADRVAAEKLIEG